MQTEKEYMSRFVRSTVRSSHELMMYVPYSCSSSSMFFFWLLAVFWRYFFLWYTYILYFCHDKALCFFWNNPHLQIFISYFHPPAHFFIVFFFVVVVVLRTCFYFLFTRLTRHFITILHSSLSMYLNLYLYLTTFDNFFLWCTAGTFGVECDTRNGQYGWNFLVAGEGAGNC